MKDIENRAFDAHIARDTVLSQTAVISVVTVLMMTRLRPHGWFTSERTREPFNIELERFQMLMLIPEPIGLDNPFRKYQRYFQRFGLIGHFENF